VYTRRPRSLLWVVWVPLLGLTYPVPWVGAFATVAGVVSILAVTHLKLPAAWRRDPGFRRRLRWHHAAQLYILVMCAQYWAFSAIFFLTPRWIQWVLAFFLTAAREGGAILLTAICGRVAGSKDDDSLETIVNSLIIFYHQTFLSVCVAGLGTDVTNYTCVVLDFLCNMFLLYKTYKAQKSQNQQHVRQHAQILVVSESLGIIIPLAYLACLYNVYAGSNATNLGINLCSLSLPADASPREREE
jgi:hypothetical protein